MATPQCRLFLMTPATADPARARECMEAAAAAGDVASILISSSVLAQALTAPAQSKGIAVLIEGDPELAKKVKADGVMVTGTIEDHATARATLGRDAIVGVPCETRDQAMDAAEAGADFILFADPALVSWWTEVSVVPCVALHGGDNAEFRVPAMSMWDGPDAARAAVQAIMTHAH